MEWTIEGRRSRVEEITGLLQSMAAQHPAAQFPAAMQTEWEALLAEQREHTMNLAAVDARARDMETAAALAGVRNAQMAAAGGFTGDAPRDGSAAAVQGAAPGASPVYGNPAFVRSHGNEIYDLGAIRQQARSADDLGPLYKDNALRAIERGKFPGHDDTAAVQGRVAKLLARVPDRDGEIAQRILATGNPEYSRVFGLALRSGGPHMLNPRDQQILGALGTSTNSGADGGFAVPFELDPSVTLTSDGSINPLRDMADVRQITSKELDLVNTAGVTVSRGAENSVNTDNSPSLSQPTIKPQRVQGFIPFSVEIEGDWAGLQAEMMALLADAKDQEEATGANGFVLGDGTAPHAGGLITTFGTAQQILTAGSATFAVADVYAVKNAVGPRFRSRGQFLTDSAIYDLVRQFGTGTMANVWVDLGAGRPPQLIGYPARELSTMDTATTSGKKILVFGDFKTGFLIVDRVGMNMELVPQLFQQATAGTGVGYPTGQRGYYCWWRNNSMIRAAAALKMLVVR
jgi:HK97 family phage major capsid protein